MTKQPPWKVISVQDVAMSDSRQRQLLAPVISRNAVGSENISIGSILMPPGKTSKVHIHQKHEIIVVLLEGHCATLFGPDLVPEFHKPGDFVYIPPGVVHAAVNVSKDFRAIAVEARTDPYFNEDVELVPNLDHRALDIAEKLQVEHSDPHPGYGFTDLL